MSKENIPEAYLCPLTLDIIEDPVIAPDGYTYEKSTIIKHLQMYGNSPMTRQPLDESQLIPNRALRDAIQAWTEQSNAGSGENPNEEPELDHESQEVEGTIGNILHMGETLYVGDSLVSRNAKYKAIMQGDGNFCVYKGLGAPPNAAQFIFGTV